MRPVSKSIHGSAGSANRAGRCPPSPPLSSGMRLLPSSVCSFGLSGRPARSSMVGKKSMETTGSLQTLPCLVTPGGTDDSRFAHPALVEPALACSQGKVASRTGTAQGAEPAVVTEEDNDRVIGEPEFVELGGQGAHAVVDRGRPWRRGPGCPWRMRVLPSCSGRVGVFPSKLFSAFET